MGRSPGEGSSYPLQYSGLENPMDYSPWGHKESDMTEQLSLHFTSLFWFFPDKYLEVELLRYGRDACTQLCLTLCDPMDCSPLGSSAHRIFQERIMEWVVISFSRGSSQPRSPTLQADSLPAEPPGKPLKKKKDKNCNSHFLRVLDLKR